MNDPILTDEQIESEVAKLNIAWAHIPGEGLVRVFETKGFAEGLALVERIGGVAERLTHYPEVTLRSDEVDVAAFTIEVSGVTQADIELAKAIVSVRSPLAGTVVEVNGALAAHPERIHEDPLEVVHTCSLPRWQG